MVDLAHTVDCPVSADAFVVSSTPSKSYASSTAKAYRLDSGQAYPYINFALPRDLAGATVLSAKFSVNSSETWPGTRTLSAQASLAPKKWSAVNWNNKPGLVAGSAPRTATIRPGTTVWYDFDVTADLQAVANGAAFAGFRVVTTDTTLRYLRGHSDPYGGRPRLVLVYSHTTPVPAGISPDGPVALDKPTFVWEAPGGITAVQVQADVVGGAFTAPSWDSGTLSDPLSISGQVDTNALGWSGLAGGSADLRFRQFGPSGWSDWSHPVSVTSTVYPVLTLLQPTGVTNDPDPQHTWTFANQSAFQVLITEVATGKVVFDSGKLPGADQSFTPELADSVRLPDLSSMTSEVRVWDNVVDRMPSPGDPGFVSATTGWTVDVDVATEAPWNVTVIQPAPESPMCIVRWQRAGGASDEWAITFDDVLVARFDGTELQIDATSWLWPTWLLPPNQATTVKVFAIAAGKGSARVQAAPITPLVTGLWVYDPETGANFSVASEDPASGLDYADSSIIYRPAYASAPIKKSLALRGLEGQVTGEITDFGDRTVAEQLEDYWYIRANPNKTYRVIFGTENFPALITNPSAVTAADSLAPFRMNKRVSFEVDQVGEFPAVLS